MQTIVCSGSYDPVTNGHMALFRDAAAVADKVLIYIAVNPNKKTMFTPQQRLNMIQDALKDEPFGRQCSVSILAHDYVVRQAMKDGATYLMRGLRNNTDMEYEMALQQANQRIAPSIRTIFSMFAANDPASGVSSSFVKGFVGPVGWHHHVKDYLPHATWAAMMKYVIERKLCEWTGLSAQEMGLDEALEGYMAPKRHYHTLEHLCHLISEYDAYRTMMGSTPQQDRVLALTILWHDALDGVDAEMRSAQKMAHCVHALSDHVIDDVKHIIHDTAYGSKGSCDTNIRDELIQWSQLFQHLDLCILGVEADWYDQYERQVRQEYIHVDESVYSSKRFEVMRHLYQNVVCGELFGTSQPYWYHRYHDSILNNLERYAHEPFAHYHI